jgi:hypothetical protein
MSNPSTTNDEPMPSEVITRTPEDAYSRLSETGESVGGPFTGDPSEAGSIGRTMFDMPTSKDGTITVLLPSSNLDTLSSQALVRIESRGDGRVYLGAVVQGPFAEPDGLRADATPMVVTTVQGGLLTPKYHGRVQVELIGERLANGAVVPPRRRPKPNSPVFALDATETADVMRIRGNLVLGIAEGFDDLQVRVPPESKSVFPRHMAILGTTGGGKSTTVSGLVAKAQQENIAVVLIDTEGEYCAINEPSADGAMVEALKSRGLAPQGVGNTHVLKLAGRDAANEKHPDLQDFTLRFSALSPFAVSEILELNEAQETRFLKAYDLTKTILDQLKIWPTTNEQRNQLLELDELEEGHPGMTLQHLHDVVKQIAAVVGKDADPQLRTPAFDKEMTRIKQIISGAQVPSHKFSWFALQGKLGRLVRLGIFDSQKVQPFNFSEMLQPGRVTIVDLSDTDSPQINNLAIAELLRGLRMAQEQKYQAAVKQNQTPTPAVIFIEEAHEFLSEQRIRQMPVLFQQVASIARRGRKRWLGLVFITQLPQHLPHEALGLVNNWILHKIGDSSVIDRLRRSIGGIDDSLWRHVPSLAPGQAVVSFTTLARPMQVAIDPTPCRLLMVE